jgi:hypothetical protein
MEAESSSSGWSLTVRRRSWTISLVLDRWLANQILKGVSWARQESVIGRPMALSLVIMAIHRVPPAREVFP